MAKKYLITPKKKNSLIQKEVFRKGKKFFYIETIWDKPEIVVDKNPNLKAFNPTEGFLLNTFKFKSGELDSKSKLIVPENIPDIEAKKIKNEYRKYGYIFDIEGWESSEVETRVFGDLDAEETPYHLITLRASEIEGFVMKIAKDRYESYLSEGIPQEEYEELEENKEFSGPIYDELTIIDIDGIEIPNFQKLFKIKYNQSIEEYEKQYKPKLISKNKKIKSEYAVIGERWIKRSWYTLEIFEEFDIKKINIEISRDVYFGRTDYVNTFSLNYAGKEFEFKENYGPNSEDYYLMTSAGDRNSFDIIYSDEEDWDEDEVEVEEPIARDIKTPKSTLKSTKNNSKFKFQCKPFLREIKFKGNGGYINCNYTWKHVTVGLETLPKYTKGKAVIEEISIIDFNGEIYPSGDEEWDYFGEQIDRKIQKIFDSIDEIGEPDSTDGRDKCISKLVISKLSKLGFELFSDKYFMEEKSSKKISQ